VLENILKNAIETTVTKHSNPPYPPVKIKVYKQNSSTLFEIADSGEGINPEQLKKIPGQPLRQSCRRPQQIARR
jgi:signal transduction histidine kinase